MRRVQFPAKSQRSLVHKVQAHQLVVYLCISRFDLKNILSSARMGMWPINSWMASLVYQLMKKEYSLSEVYE